VGLVCVDYGMPRRLSPFWDDDTSAHTANTAQEACRDRCSDPLGGNSSPASAAYARMPTGPLLMMNVTRRVMRGKAEMTSDQAMRASDRDRELAAEVLRDAYAVGRLDLEEFHDRAGAAYSARTWGELRELTADLPTGQVLSRVTSGADSHPGVARLGHAPWRPFAPIWVMAVVWLAIAARCAHSSCDPARPLSLFVLRAARWTMRPEQPPQCRVNPGGEHAAHTQPLWATQVLGRVPDDQVKRAEWEQRGDQLRLWRSRDNPCFLCEFCRVACAPAGTRLASLPAQGDDDLHRRPRHRLKFWHHVGAKFVYCTNSAIAKPQHCLADLAEVAARGEMLDDLSGRGIGRLMVEGDGTMHTQVPTAGLVDEIPLATVCVIGDVALLRYPTSSRTGRHSRSAGPGHVEDA
jgi:hypothetical protein